MTEHQIKRLNQLEEYIHTCVVTTKIGQRQMLRRLVDQHGGKWRVCKKSIPGLAHKPNP